MPYPEISLSRFVNKKVKATTRNGVEHIDFIKYYGPVHGNGEYHTIFKFGVHSYWKDGSLKTGNFSPTPCGLDIIKIEEVKQEIDLSQFADKLVKVTTRNGVEHTDYLKYQGSIHNNGEFSNRKLLMDVYKFGVHTYYKDGSLLRTGVPNGNDIIKIEEVEQEIDLSKFLDKKVKVTFRCGIKSTGTVVSGHTKNHPYILYTSEYFPSYTERGFYDADYHPHSRDIVEIALLVDQNDEGNLRDEIAQLRQEFLSLKQEVTSLKLPGKSRWG